MTIAYRDEAEFQGTNGCLYGEATYDIEVAYELNADAGGRDGWQVTGCELVDMRLDGLHLSRAQVVAASDEVQVRRAEDEAARFVEDNIDEFLFEEVA